jgi:hypothetical protein
MLERRIARRIASPLTFWIWPAAAGTADAILAELGDISANGVYFWATRRLEMAAPLRMILLRQMGRPKAESVMVVVSGKVIRLDAPRADGNYGMAARVERYHVLEPGATLPHDLQHLVAP